MSRNYVPSSSRPFLFCIALVASTATLVACDGGGEAAPNRASTNRDGALEAVDNRDPKWSGDDAWLLGEPLMELGSGTEPEAQFNGVVGAVKLSDGRVAVGDRGSSQVRLFDSRGALAATAGRAGAGPEEFGMLTGVVQGRGDSLVAFDAGNGRLAVIDPAGAFGRVVSLPDAGFGASLGGVLDSGHFLLGIPLASAPKEGVTRDSILYVLFAADGTPADTLGVAAGGQQFQRVNGNRVTRLTLPFGPQPAASARGSHVYVGASDQYEIRQYRSPATSPRIVRRQVSPQPFTDEHMEEFLARAPQFRAAVQEIPRPAHVPVFSSFVVDRDGNLWVREYPSPGAVRAAWSVFDPDGVMLGDVALPANFRATEIGSDYVLGVWTDDEDVERVRLYQLNKPAQRL